MRILVTGGTGFVCSHSVKALLDAGHEVRLLVRSPGRLRPALGPLGVGQVDHVVGDATDPAAVRRAMEGCQAVLHAASVYAFDRRRAAELASVNPRCAEMQQGLGPRRFLLVAGNVTFAELIDLARRASPSRPRSGGSRPAATRLRAAWVSGRARCPHEQNRGVTLVLVVPGPHPGLIGCAHVPGSRP